MTAEQKRARVYNTRMDAVNTQVNEALSKVPDSPLFDKLSPETKAAFQTRVTTAMDPSLRPTRVPGGEALATDADSNSWLTQKMQADPALAQLTKPEMDLVFHLVSNVMVPPAKALAIVTQLSDTIKSGSYAIPDSFQNLFALRAR